MASQVLIGSSNPSYTNNTGQNVRILINYMASCTSMTWEGVTVTAAATTIGKSIPPSYKSNSFSISGTISGSISPNVSLGSISGTLSGGSGSLNLDPVNSSFPVELTIASGQSFSALSGAYNIVVIKEDGN